MDEAITITWDNDAKRINVKFDPSVWKDWLGLRGAIQQALWWTEQTHEMSKMQGVQELAERNARAQAQLRNGVILK